MQSIDDLRTSLQYADPAVSPNISAIISRGQRQQRTRRVLAGVIAAVGVVAASMGAVQASHRNSAQESVSVAIGNGVYADAYLYRRTIYLEQKPKAPDVYCATVSEDWTAFDEQKPGRMVVVNGVVPPPAGWRGDPKSLPARTGCSYKVEESEKVMQGTVGMPNMPPYRGSWSQPTKAFVAALPSTPAELLQRVITMAQQKSSTDEKEHQDLISPTSTRKYQVAYFNLQTLLASEYPHLTPTARVTVLQTIELIPGVQNLGPTKDLLGRTGLALMGPPEPVESRKRETRTIVDPQTGEFLGTNLADGGGSAVTSVVVLSTKRPSDD